MSELIKREDAISRKELLDYINDHREDFSDYNGYSQMFDFVDAMSTVDAVPVEWIQGFMNRLRNKGQTVCVAAIQGMLEAYGANGEREPANGYDVMVARMLE